MIRQVIFTALSVIVSFLVYGEVTLNVSLVSTSLQNQWEPQLPLLSLPTRFTQRIHVDFFDNLGMEVSSLWDFDPFIGTECCGFLWRAGISFTARDRVISIALTLQEIPFLCCGLSFDAMLYLTAPGKTLTFSPRWERWYGPSFEVYGDPLRLEVYGWGVLYEMGPLLIRELVALDPYRMGELAGIPFYPGEREYWSLRYTFSTLTFTSEFWWGEGDVPFALRRTRLSLVFPIYEGFKVVVEGEWDFSTEDPFDLLNIRWEVEF